MVTGHGRSEYNVNSDDLDPTAANISAEAGVAMGVLSRLRRGTTTAEDEEWLRQQTDGWPHQQTAGVTTHST